MPTSDLQLRRLGLCPMTDLPNREGFRFMGRTRDGQEIECVVARNFLTKLHSVAEYDRLVGWRNKS